MPVLDQLTQSNLSLDGTSGLSGRNFNFTPSPTPLEPTTTKSGYPNSPLHRNYSVFNDPKNTLAVNFNGQSVLQTATVSSLDETDPNAPANPFAISGVIKEYKSSPGQKYSDKGPAGGHF